MVGSGTIGHDDFGILLRNQPCSFGETVSLAGHGKDVSMLLGTLPQRLSQHKDVAAEVSLSNKGARPDRPHQFFLCHKFRAVANQDEENLKGFGSYWNRLTGTK